MTSGWWEQLDAPVLGRYRIERLLGEGGMARVFLATDVRADRPVAFKTPKLESFPPESVDELLGRFKREFRSMASDPIQGVIPIYESGEFTDDAGVVRPFLAMQYLSGGSLGDLLGGHIGQRTHRQTLGEVLDWLVPIARTVDRLHARKYLHRDIKPDNILFNSDGDPFLADLGIVGSLDPGMGGSMLGSTSMGVLGSPGSPGYQSPESIQADPALRNITASDQFSLAVTVYEALAGKLPVDAGTNQAWYGALMHWSPMPLSMHCPDLPAAASDAVMKAMSAQPSGRFTTCSEFAKAIEEARLDRPRAAATTPAPPSRPEPPGPAAATAVRGRIARGWIAGAILSLCAIAVIWHLLDPTAVTEVPTSSPVRRQPVQQPEASPEQKFAARLASLCKEAGGTASRTARNGCQLPGNVMDWPVRFDKGDATLRPDAMRVLDEVAEATNKEGRTYGLSVTAHSEQPAGVDWRVDSLATMRVVAVMDYLHSRGVAGPRLERFLPPESAAPGPVGLLELRLEPRLPMEPAANAWIICVSTTSRPRSRSAYFAASEPMEVMDVPDWLQRIKAERPDRPVLQSAGLPGPDPMFVACLPAAPSAQVALALEPGWLAEYSRAVKASGYTSVTRLEPRWHLRGTGRDPSAPPTAAGPAAADGHEASVRCTAGSAKVGGCRADD
jgi:serine/threonine protein kinase